MLQRLNIIFLRSDTSDLERNYVILSVVKDLSSMSAWIMVIASFILQPLPGAVWRLRSRQSTRQTVALCGQ